MRIWTAFAAPLLLCRTVDAFYSHLSYLPKTAARASPLFVSAALQQQDDPRNVTNSGGAGEEVLVVVEEKKRRLEMPWSDLHSFALDDNLPRYTRVLPGKTPKSFALWRTMMQDVPELSGYPIQFLREKLEEEAPEVLPYLDEFYFEPSGGLSGKVYGVAGLKDGTKIETSSVGQVEVTIPLGYVLTETEGIAYELGKPLPQMMEEGGYDLDGAAGKIVGTAGALGQQAAATLSDAIATTPQKGTTTVGSEEDPNAMLVRLGASTGLLLAGATAMSMLSHHLTVNVFWV